MFSIKLVDCDVWVGKKNISYFVRDDSYFILTKNDVKIVFYFGVTPERKRVFLSTDEIRRSLSRCNKETVIESVVLLNGINIEVLTNGNSLGKFSNYVVVDLVNDTEYSLDDVLNCII